MPDYLRIKDPSTGDEYTYDNAKVEALGLSEHVIDKPALGPDRLPAPVKPNLPLGEPVPGSKVERRRTAKKAAAKKAEPPPADPPETPGADSAGENAGQQSASPEGDN